MSEWSHGGLRIAFLGYRTWAISLAQRLVYTEGPRKWSIVHVIGTRDCNYGKLMHGGYQESTAKQSYIDPAKFDNLESLIAESKANLILAYGWSWMIPKFNWHIPVIILHPSKLPKYRGGSPLQHQILAGETESAVTLFYATDKIDAGPILFQRSLSLAGSLNDIFKRIEDIGFDLTVPMLDLLAAGGPGSLCGIPQDESQATTYMRRKPEQSEITIEEIQGSVALKLADKVRCLQHPYPLPFIRCKDGTKLFLTGAHAE